ncbi:MAG: TFIIB-type zinc ribbon-containing protein, partial [Nitrososphaeraceae archaeon]
MQIIMLFLYKIMKSSINCPVCNRSNQNIADPDSGEIICGNCGTVILE